MLQELDQGKFHKREHLVLWTQAIQCDAKQFVNLLWFLLRVHRLLDFELSTFLAGYLPTSSLKQV